MRMIDLKNIFTLKYHPKLLNIFITLTLPGVLSANIIAPLIVVYVLYDFIPPIQIYSWLFAHFFLFFGRVFLAKKLRYLLNIKSIYVEKYLKISLILTTLTALLYGVAIWSSVLYDVSDLHIFTTAVIIISLSAGAISTLVSFFYIYVLYIVFSMLPLISAISYHGGELFNVFAFLLSIFTITILTAGYRQYTTLKNSISLEEMFKTIYEKSSDGILIIKEKRFQDCNEKMVKMFDYSTKEELLHTHVSQFMPKYQPDGTRSTVKMLQMLHMAFSNGTNSFEWLHKKKDGSLFWTEIVLTKITLNGEELVHGDWRDIEDRKKLEIAKESANKEIEALNKSLEQRVEEEVEKNREKEKQLMQQSRMAQMGEMISMIAHQWRQPLSAISATSASIELKASMDRLDNNTAQQKARDISNFSQHLSNTIDDFRNFFKPNKKKIKSTYDEVIKSVLDIIEVSIDNQNIQLFQELNCQESLHTYPNELQQVILNLIKNAEDVLLDKKIKDPYIKIATYKENDHLVLTVSDNGGGIPEDIIDKIFNPYFSTKMKKDGTGLGLYMSKTIIEEHCSGKLYVSNNDDGAVFTIQLSTKEQS